MTAKKTFSLPDDVAAYLEDQPNASAVVTAALRAHQARENTAEVLRELGVRVTAEGRERWRQRLAEPIPSAALRAGQAMLDQDRSAA